MRFMFYVGSIRSSDQSKLKYKKYAPKAFKLLCSLKGVTLNEWEHVYVFQNMYQNEPSEPNLKQNFTERNPMSKATLLCCQ